MSKKKPRPLVFFDEASIFEIVTFNKFTAETLTKEIIKNKHLIKQVDELQSENVQLRSYQKTSSNLSKQWVGAVTESENAKDEIVNLTSQLERLKAGADKLVEAIKDAIHDRYSDDCTEAYEFDPLVIALSEYQALKGIK